MMYEDYENLTAYFFEKYHTVPTGCRYCQPNASDADGWTRIVTEQELPCPNCGRILTEFYAPEGE